MPRDWNAPYATATWRTLIAVNRCDSPDRDKTLMGIKAALHNRRYPVTNATEGTLPMPPRKKTTWLLVGDGISAQFYDVHAIPLRVKKVRAGTLTATPKLVQGPEHKPATRHIAHNVRGRAEVQRHENVFIERVAAKLEAAAAARKFDDVIVVLPPKALAHFRKVAGSATQKKIKQQIRSEWTHLATPDLEKNLAKRLP
jgi:protein required for attachment to host cells